MDRYKLSNYIVETPLFIDPLDEKEKLIVFSTRTSKQFIIPSEIWENIKGRDPDCVDLDTLNEIVTAKIFVNSEENELLSVLNENIEDAAIYDTLYMVVQPTAACQLGCGYCGQEHTAAWLKSEHQTLMLERCASKLSSGRYRHLEVGWFGAEPLLGLKVIRQMAPEFKRIADLYCCSYRSKMVTNGLNLTEEVAKELHEIGVDYLEITLDGTAVYHDTRRIFKNGKASFEAIFDNLLNVTAMNSPRPQISIRCNVDVRNRDGVIPLIHLLASKGLQDKIERFYVAPIHAWGNDAEKDAAEKEEFAQWEISWFAEMSRLGFPIRLIPGRAKIVCMVAKPGAELVDSYGNIYNCSEVSYVPSYNEANSDGSEKNKYAIGHLEDPQPATQSPFSDFHHKVENAEFPCATCRLLPACGGACPKNWFEGHVPCPPEKYNIEHRLFLNYMLKKGAVVI